MTHEDHDHGETCRHGHAPENGHEGACCGHDHGGEPGRRESVSLAAAGVLTGGALLVHVLHLGPAALTPALAGAAMAAGGWLLLPKAWRAVRRLRPDINLLTVIAAAGAAFIGDWTEAAVVIFLFGVAEWLEGWADRRARRATTALLDLAPVVAWVRRDGGFVERPVDEVAVGETIATRSGMAIPLDGVVRAGESSVNQAPITGESVPVDKRPGDTVFAGTINGEGALEVEVTKAAGDTTLARIIRLVAEAQERRAPTQRFVDVFARYYTPAVACAALLVFLLPPLLAGGAWDVWLYRACVLLVVACPCALVISTPVSIVAGLTALARRGVLVKGGAHLETIGRVKALALDKTGTITTGRPCVQAVELVNAPSAAEVLRIASAVDAHSSHPLARAIAAHAAEQEISPARATGYLAHSGRGAEGVVDGHIWFVGNHRFTHELGVCSEELERRLAAHEAQGRTVIVVGHRPHDDCRGEVLGFIAVGDTLRPGAPAAIAALHAAGVERVVLLSGDNQRTADHMARAAGIDEARGDLLPADKVAAVQALRNRHGIVAMVGDGVNDAPALAAASVGIAMGAAGTDAAIETADIALMKDDLGRIAETIHLGRRTLRIIYSNVAFALGLKALFLVLAVLGLASLWLAILADTGATLLVTANALRLLRHKP